MKGRFLAVFGWMGTNSCGKTFFVTWGLGAFAAFSLHGALGAIAQWFFFILAYQLQAMVNRAYQNPFKRVFAKINREREERLHQERMTRAMMARGFNPETARSASDVTIAVLGFSDYSLPAA